MWVLEAAYCQLTWPTWHDLSPTFSYLHDLAIVLILALPFTVPQNLGLSLHLIEMYARTGRPIIAFLDHLCRPLSLHLSTRWASRAR